MNANRYKMYIGSMLFYSIQRTGNQGEYLPGYLLRVLEGSCVRDKSQHSLISRDLLRKRLQELAVKVITHALPKFLSRKFPSWFDDSVLAVDSFRFNIVEPRTLDGQPAGNDAHTNCACLSLLQHTLIVLTQPSFDLFTHMPGDLTHAPHLPH